MNPFSFFFRKTPRLGLTLGGGGARGLAHIAFLKVLDELGLKPAVISGASMGALIGALYASGNSGLEIERIFKELNFFDIVSMVDISWWHAGDGLVRGDKIIQTLNKLTKNKRLEDLDIPLRVVATDFWKRAEVVISQGDVGEAVRASISIPGIFEPVLRDARVMIDGGIINSLPYEVIRQECDVLVAVDVTGDSVPGENQSAKPKILESIFIAFQMMEAAQVKSKLLQSRPDIYIHPALSNIDILDFRQMDGILESVKPEAEQFRALLQSRFRQAIQELVRAPKSVLEA